MKDFGIAVQIAMVNSEAVVVVDFDRMEKDIVKEQGYLLAVVGDFDRMNMDFDRMNMDFDRMNMDFDRMNMDFDRMNMDFDRMNMDFDRMNMDFDRMNMDFDRARWRARG